MTTTAKEQTADYTVEIGFRCETGVSARVTRKSDPHRSYTVNMSTCGSGILLCTCPSGTHRPGTICRHMRLTLAALEAK